MLDSGIGDFFRQLPPILIVMFCGSSLALVAVLAVMINTRSKRARANEVVTGTTPAAAVTSNFSAPPPSSTNDGGELPDLDDLLNVTAPRAAAPSPRPAQSGTMPVTTAAGERVDAVEVMTILRDISEGGLLIRIGNQVFRNPPALADADFKRRFNSTVRDLYQSIGDTSLSKKATGEVAAAIPVEPDLMTPPAAAAPVPAAPPPIAPGAPMPGDLPKFKMPDVTEKPKRRKGPAEPIPEINIAEAIEEFLQYKLITTGQFVGRNIHVRPALGGGLRIDVDDQSYETVGDVADPAVRTFLQATIDEWQSRQ